MAAKGKEKLYVREIDGLLQDDPDYLKPLLKASLEALLEGQMSEQLGAGSSERKETRKGYRAGYYTRGLVTRVGKLALRVPRDREGRFSSGLFERYQPGEEALVAALAEMYVQGVSTQKVRAMAEALCGHPLSAATVSAIVTGLEGALERFAERPLSEPFPCMVLDLHHQEARVDGVIQPRRALVAIGADWEGRRQLLDLAPVEQESVAGWKALLEGMKRRGLHGVEFIMGGDHPGLRHALAELLTEAAWQRCFVHYL